MIIAASPEGLAAVIAYRSSDYLGRCNPQTLRNPRIRMPRLNLTSRNAAEVCVLSQVREAERGGEGVDLPVINAEKG